MGILRESDALLEGHFVLRSGRHSRQYFQCALALQRMSVVERLARALVERIRHHEASTLLAPAMGGLVIGQEIARQLGLRFIYAEKDGGGALALRRGFRISCGERILIAEDVVTRGGRIQESIAIVEDAGGEVAAVAALVDRSEEPLPFQRPFYSLLQLTPETYGPGDLPPDLEAVPACRPGSRPSGGKAA